MNSLSDYYSDTDRELLELLKYHQKHLNEMEKAGVADADKEEKFKLLGEFREVVNTRAQQRKDMEEDARKEHEDLMKERMEADCEQCAALRPVQILREEKHLELGFRCDVVKCSVCRAEFLNYMPNNWDDRMQFFDVLIADLSKAGDDGKTLAEQGNVREENAAMIEGFRKLKNVQLEVDKRRSEYEAKVKAADKAIEGARDYLLMTKMNKGSWGAPPAFS